jgi:hypothetical protein
MAEGWVVSRPVYTVGWSEDALAVDRAFTKLWSRSRTALRKVTAEQQGQRRTIATSPVLIDHLGMSYSSEVQYHFVHNTLNI